MRLSQHEREVLLRLLKEKHDKEQETNLSNGEQKECTEAYENYMRIPEHLRKYSIGTLTLDDFKDYYVDQKKEKFNAAQAEALLIETAANCKTFAQVRAELYI